MFSYRFVKFDLKEIKFEIGRFTYFHLCWFCQNVLSKYLLIGVLGGQANLAKLAKGRWFLGLKQFLIPQPHEKNEVHFKSGQK